MLESSIESSCRTHARTQGGYLLKLFPIYVGLPDRILLRPGGRVDFIEFKQPGKYPTKIQRFWHERLRELGFTVHVMRTKAEFVSLF
jgi:hypothetical protein